jgi:hypothetical protein
MASMSELPDDIKQQFATIELQPDLVRCVVVAWSNLKEMEAMEAPEVLLDEQRRLLAERLNRLQAWSENFLA